VELIYSLTFGFFNVSVSISNYISQNGGKSDCVRIYKGILKEVVVAQFETLSCNLPGRTEGNYENLIQCSCCPERGSNRSPLEYKLPH
jgi:hypothetical protein